MSVDSNCPWVSVTPAPTTGLAWRVTQIRHMTKEEVRGRHHVFIFLKISGRVIYDGLFIQYGWEGQHDDEKQQPKPLDKRPPDPSTDIPIEPGMHVWFQVNDPAGFPSDKISNLHAEMIDEDGDWGHHCYEVTLCLQIGDAVTPPVVVTPPIVDIQSIIDGMIGMARTSEKLAQDLQAAVAKLNQKG